MFSTFSFRISGPKAFAFHPQLNSSHLCCPHFSSPQPHVSSDRGGSLLPGLIVSTFMGRVVSLVRIVQCISMAAKLKLTDLNIISGPCVVWLLPTSPAPSCTLAHCTSNSLAAPLPNAFLPQAARSAWDALSVTLHQVSCCSIFRS